MFIAIGESFPYNCVEMPKTAPLAFRIPDQLKRDLQEVADREARSVSQICEILLKIGVDAYKKDGPTYLHRFLARARGKTE